jgi:hypothetical protein
MAESLRSGEGKKEYTNHMVSSKSRTSVQPESTAVLPESDLGRPVFRCLTSRRERAFCSFSFTQSHGQNKVGALRNRGPLNSVRLMVRHL